MALSSWSKKTLFCLMKMPFGMERLPPYCLVHKSVQGKLLAKVPVLWQAKEDACYTMRNKRNFLACFYNEKTRSIWKRCAVRLWFVFVTGVIDRSQYDRVQLSSEAKRKQTKEIWMILFIDLFCLCPLGLTIKMSCNISKVANKE